MKSEKEEIFNDDREDEDAMFAATEHDKMR
jgi:hypothetical protein